MAGHVKHGHALAFGTVVLFHDLIKLRLAVRAYFGVLALAGKPQRKAGVGGVYPVVQIGAVVEANILAVAIRYRVKVIYVD